MDFKEKSKQAAIEPKKGSSKRSSKLNKKYNTLTGKSIGHLCEDSI